MKSEEFNSFCILLPSIARPLVACQSKKGSGEQLWAARGGVSIAKAFYSPPSLDFVACHSKKGRGEQPLGCEGVGLYVLFFLYLLPIYKQIIPNNTSRRSTTLPLRFFS